MSAGSQWQCGVCGRFVPEENAGLFYDYYMGGWEADPRCSLHGGRTHEAIAALRAAAVSGGAAEQEQA